MVEKLLFRSVIDAEKLNDDDDGKTHNRSSDVCFGYVAPLLLGANALAFKGVGFIHVYVCYGSSSYYY